MLKQSLYVKHLGTEIFPGIGIHLGYFQKVLYKLSRINHCLSLLY